MLGTEFARTLGAAQAGDEKSFVRLWRDANPAMIRYLRVVGSDDPYDGACEGWVTVVRGLPGFTGDEVAWRVWLMACTRLRAEEGTLREGWGSVTVLPGITVTGDGELDIDSLLEPEESVDPAHRGLNDTLTALRALPQGEGEVVLLRHGASLPVDAVADVVGVDPEAVSRLEASAFARLGADEELVAWSLAAPATAAELADEQVATAAFRNLPHRGRRLDSSRWDIGRQGADRFGGRRHTPSGGRPGKPGRPHVVLLGAPSVDPPRRRRGARVAGLSRTAVVAVVAISGSAMSLGGLSAAAYVGVLPDGVQQVMHDAIGAPAPTAAGPTSQGTGPGRPGGRTQPNPTVTGPVVPRTAGSPAVGLCRGWASDKAKGTAREGSVAFRNLATVAGGASKVEQYCAVALSTAKPTTPATTPTGTSSATTTPLTTTTPPSTTTTPPPTTTPAPTTTTPPPTTTPAPTTTTPPPTTKVPNPNSPTKAKAPHTSSPRKTPNATDPATSPTQSTEAGAGETRPTTGPGAARTTRTSTDSGSSSADSTTPTPVTMGGGGRTR